MQNIVMSMPNILRKGKPYNCKDCVNNYRALMNAATHREIRHHFLYSCSTIGMLVILTFSPPASIEWPADQGWIKANARQTGFYRVNYDKENWEAITAYLKENPGSPVRGLVQVIGCICPYTHVCPYYNNNGSFDLHVARDVGNEQFTMYGQKSNK